MKRDIAIIGMSGRFPKSDSIEEFWKNLVDGKELIHFYSDEELKQKGVDKKEMENPNYVKVSSFINASDEFDYAFFKYTLNEAMVMNPQTRIFHQLVWTAIEDAALNIDKYNKKIGIFTGANNDLNWSVSSLISKNEHVDAFTKSKLSNPNFMASLIAFKLNLKGPCYFLDTACSTSLSAAHLACRSLLLHECGVAIVGGIKIFSFEDNGYMWQEGSIMSNDGHNRSFDANSSGTVGSEGGGVVILKKLEEALKDNDNIYAVIKASAMNNDGSLKAGYTMPSVEGQSECIKLAQRIAGVKPIDITYIEAHGTATKIGDPIEIESLNIAFENNTDHKCAVGSVKSNMGHADEAAGIISLIKTSLAIKNRTLPVSINYTQPNPTINFNAGPFYVNTESKEWKRHDNKPLIAGVNSLGIGGTNIHMILAEAPVVLEKSNQERKPYLLTYSANSLESLELYETKLINFIEQHNNLNLADLAYTLQVGRKRFNYGKYLVVNDSSQAIDILKNKSPKTIGINPKNNAIFMFSGQGSQYFNMGRELYEEEIYFKNVLDEGFEYLFNQTNRDYKQVIYGDEVDSEKINKTEYTQPILFLFEYALAKLLMHWGIKPDYMVGHSLGEYVAACISGVFSFEDGLKIISKRAELMGSVARGTMLSIGASLDSIDKQLIRKVSVAAVNSAGTFVLSGEIEEIKEVKKELKSIGIASIELKTSHAFHSNMMEGMLDAYEKELNTIEFSEPQIPFVSNITGDFISATAATSPSYWLKHITEPVNFKESINKLISIDDSIFIEIGPGKTLMSFYKQSQDLKLNNSVFNTVRGVKETINDTEFLTELLGVLWSNGLSIDWEEYHHGETRQKIAAPTYVFDVYEFPVKVSPYKEIENTFTGLNKEESSNWFYMSSWKRALRNKVEKSKTTFGNDCILFSDASRFSENLKKGLIQNGKNVIEVFIGKKYSKQAANKYIINPNEEQDYMQLVAEIKNASYNYDHIIYCWDLNEPDKVSEHLEKAYSVSNRTFHSTLKIIKHFDLSTVESSKKITLVTNENYQVLGSEKSTSRHNHISSLLNILTQENLNIYACNIDIERKDLNSGLMSQVIQEIESNEKFFKVAFRNGRRWISYFEHVYSDYNLNNQYIKSKGVYLITEGLSHAGYLTANYLLKNNQTKVILAGSEAISELGKEKIESLEKLQILPGTIEYLNCDLADYKMFSLKIKEIENKYGEINGIIHTAKDTDFKNMMPIDKITLETIEDHFSSRVDTAINIYRVFKDKNIDFVRFISSLSSFLGGIAHGAYASAGTLMDSLILSKQEELNNWKTISFDRISNDKTTFISDEEFIEAFEKSFLFPELSQLVVSKRNINQKQIHSVKNEEKNSKNAIVHRTSLKSDYEAPGTEMEKQITLLFEELFGVNGIGINDDFFELGGDSLKGMMFINKVEKTLNYKLLISDIFSSPSVLELSTLIEEKKWLVEEKEAVNEMII